MLITLFNADHDGLRMTDLAAAIVLSQAGLTHLVTRLERARLVTRHNDPADRRSFRVRLTESGRERLDAARATHNDVIRSGFTRRLSASQLRALAAAWSALTS